MTRANGHARATGLGRSGFFVDWEAPLAHDQAEQLADRHSGQDFGPIAAQYVPPVAPRTSVDTSPPAAAAEPVTTPPVVPEPPRSGTAVPPEPTEDPHSPDPEAPRIAPALFAPDPPPTAADAPQPTKKGWLPRLRRARPSQRALFTDVQRAELVRRARRDVDPPFTVTVTSLKGGVGKTTVSALLGLTLAEQRGDRVVAVDANLHAGTLSNRLIRGKPRASVQHLLDNLVAGAEPASIADISRYTEVVERLSILAGHTNPSVGAAFAGEDYSELIECLGRWWHVVLADCGTGLADEPMRAILDNTDALVIVATPTFDAVSLAQGTLDWLQDNQYQHLVDNSIAVLSHAGGLSSSASASDLRAQFLERSRCVVDIPAEEQLSAGGRIRLASMGPATRDAALLLAAAVIDAAPEPVAP